VRVPTIRFLGGVREIGGTKLLLEEGPDRLLFDFGPSFGPRYEQFFFEFLQPRSTSPVRDLLEFDLLPWLPGLYSREALAGSDARYEPPSVHAVFVSHAHFDHAGYLRYLDPDIPVYVGAGTRRILDAIATSGSADYGEHAWRSFASGDRIRVGGLEVVPHAVDHSVPHAFGFVVHTGAGSVVYTGDFREHGPRAALTREFLSAAAAAEPTSLVIEGTRAGPDPRRNFTEEGVRRGVDELLRRTAGLALASCYPRDVDRIRTLHAAAVAAGRELVVPFRMAHLLDRLSTDRELDVPVPGKDPNLKVYHRPKRTYYRWERPWLDAAVDAETVRRRGAEILLLLDLYQFTELIDLRPPEGTPFVRSMSEPFSEEDGNEAVLQNWIGHFGLRLHQFHASGHCSGPELLAAVRRIGAPHVFPVHTEHPEAFDALGERAVPPERDRAYRVDTGRSAA
jgi:ribonuclease J